MKKFSRGRSGIEFVSSQTLLIVDGEVLVESVCSGISAGTELLVYRGDVPEEMELDASIETLAEQQSAWPVRYGYSAVGRVSQLGDGVPGDWQNRLVFAFNPHESHFCLPAENLIQVPKGISAEDAVFLPNMETAVSFLMDIRPLIGETVVVLGLGVVGQLTLQLLSTFPLHKLIGVDGYANRRNLALDSGADAVFAPEDTDLLEAIGENGVDAVLEVSGNPQAIDLALNLCGYNGRILIGSWYGKKQATVNFGGHFHRSNIQLIASQVSNLHPSLSGRWTKARRLKVVWDRIQAHKPSQRLVTHRPNVTEAPSIYAMLHQNPAEALQVIFNYS